jgi:hypothetical protein
VPLADTLIAAAAQAPGLAVLHYHRPPGRPRVPEPLILAERSCQLLIESGGSRGVHAYWKLAAPLSATRVDERTGELVEPIERANLRLIHRRGTCARAATTASAVPPRPGTLRDADDHEAIPAVIDYKVKARRSHRPGPTATRRPTSTSPGAGSEASPRTSSPSPRSPNPASSASR